MPPRPKSAGRTRGGGGGAADGASVGEAGGGATVAAGPSSVPLPAYVRPRLGSGSLVKPVPLPPAQPVAAAPAVTPGAAATTALAIPQPPSTIAWLATHRLCFLQPPGKGHFARSSNPRTRRPSSSRRARPASAGCARPLPSALLAAAVAPPAFVAAGGAEPSPQTAPRAVAWGEDTEVAEVDGAGGTVASPDEAVEAAGGEGEGPPAQDVQEFEEPLGVGDEVLVRYRSTARWYPAVVERTWPDGNCKIKWEDGETEDRMKSRKDVQLKFDTDLNYAEYSIGTYVLARWRHGPWIAAQVKEINSDGTYHVQWADRDPRNRDKHRSEMRLWRGPTPPTMAQPPPVKVPVPPPLKNPYKRLLLDAHTRADVKKDNLDAMGWYTPMYFVPGGEAWGG